MDQFNQRAQLPSPKHDFIGVQPRSQRPWADSGHTRRIIAGGGRELEGRLGIFAQAAASDERKLYS